MRANDAHSICFLNSSLHPPLADLNSIAIMSSSSWVLVTGANRGLGYLTAKKLLSDGESVIVGARTQASGAPLTLPARHCARCIPRTHSHGKLKATSVAWQSITYVLVHLFQWIRNFLFARSRPNSLACPA